MLRAEATYRDAEDEDNDKTADEVSYRSVRRAPETNTDPQFPDQNLNVDDIQTAQTREVAERTSAGTNLGAPIEASDSGDVLTYSLDNGTDAMAFDITRTTGRLITKAALDHETKETYTVTVTATDPFGAMDTSQVTITVTDVNEAPVLAGGAASIDRVENGTGLDDLSTNVREDEFTVSDEDVADTADDLTWSLSGADADKFKITGTDDMRTLAFKANPDYESPGDSGGNNVYEVTVKVTDSRGNSDEQDVTVKVTNLEEPGKIILSTLQPRVGFPVTATLADPDNITADSVSWQWYKGTVTQALLDAENGLNDTECVDANTNDCFIKGATSATYTPVAFDVGDTVVAVALYTDDRPNEDDAEDFDFAMMVTANTVLADTRNKAPVFPDQDMEMEGRQTAQERMIGENELATELVRTIGNPVEAMDFIIAPDDGEMTEEKLTYSMGGPDADSFSIDRTTAQLSTKVALDKEIKDTYTVTVTATDPSGETATVTVTIKVMDVDEPPTIRVIAVDEVLTIMGPRNKAYPENSTGLVGTYMLDDPSAASPMWSLAGDDANVFDISTAGVLTFKESPDFENPTDVGIGNNYMVTVKAKDSFGVSGSADVTIRVTNVDEVLTIAGDATIDYAENDRGPVATYMRADPSAASPMWSVDGTDADVFDISGGGVLTFKESPDFEMPTDAGADNTYMITVKAKDSFGFSGFLDVAIIVTNVDEVLTIAGDVIIDYAEDRTDPVATFIAMDPEETEISWSLAGDDAGVFDIAGGELTFKESPDFEMPADADTDNTYMVTVKADDGMFVDSHEVVIMVTNVDEVPTIAGEAAIDYAENRTDPVATFTAMDPEETEISWSLAGDDAGVFDIAGGELTFKESPDHEMPADADTDNTYMVTVKANDGAYEVVIMVTDVDELATIAGDAAIDYAENGTASVATFTAMDPEETEISWSLAGDDADVFDISTDGVLTFKESPDHEMPADADTDNTYMVTVKANDGAYEVAIMVTDVDELPTIAGDATIDYAENGTASVATFTAMDPEETEISWSLAGDDADVFDIAGGVLTFKESPDHEMPADADADNTYMVTIHATDATMKTGMKTVMVMVTDEDDTIVEQTLLEMYDANDNDQIDKSEALTAIEDYIFEGILTKDQALEVITLYIFGSS